MLGVGSHADVVVLLQQHLLILQVETAVELWKALQRFRGDFHQKAGHGQLAARGFGCWLPDLPGTGESLRPLATVTWDEWRHGVSEAADHISAVSGHPPLVASMRGGCLLDDAAEGVCHWRFAPVTGAALVRDMERAGLAGGVAWAGYTPSPALAAALAEATIAPAATIRTLRLLSDPQEADAKVDAPALWRRSEPGTSLELTEALANDLADWAMLCGA